MSLVAYDASSDEEDAGGEPPAAPPPVPSSIGPQRRPPSPSTSAGVSPQPPVPSLGSTSMVDSTSRKRESNGSAFQDPCSKFPRVQSAQSRGARIAAGNTLVPPQLSGRSNVVTEDMSKLFVTRRKE
ncbi:hypothetical protein E2562_027419 [Oryza meyeriana var. granulata]|uniref:Uncharacterized protein n=1 Tax=Oryza meyeriana var. granulata TaxID=110450 RepID=A0A6G1EQC9_9ORYZ|nr:hypothetical protein E2562_027419 [Oryza meyeriana var. granulata]